MSRGSVESSSQPRPRTGAKTLRRSSNRVDRDDIVLIDVDSEGFDSVVIIDVPESLRKKCRGSRVLSKDKKNSLATVICLDDDDGDNYDSNDDYGDMKVHGNWNNGASTSRSSRHASAHVGRSFHGEADDCEFINVSPVKLAKGKRTYSGKGTSSSDYIDCDLVEDSREQWEKAFWKRKSDSRNGRSGIERPEVVHENVGKDSEAESASAHSIQKENGSHMFENLYTPAKDDHPNRYDFSSHKHSDSSSHNTEEDTSGKSPHVNERPLESALSHGMNGDLHDHSDEDDSEICIRGEREMFKETDAYKKALEEEMASRQRALQAQAEEAQNMRRLLKREKAESMRLLDMERRQKQRIEEIRETQKKDVEDMNLKEAIRSSVRKELNQLEARSYNMASLLQGLGVLDFESTPSPNQVRLAYKKALLTFHPDRASRSDIRLQVEAEEKFKLISRMKEKYLLPV